MFKRGGTPAQGSGIMSHVEPRVKASGGYYPMPTAAERTAGQVAAGQASRQNLINQTKNIFTRGGNYLSKTGNAIRGFIGNPSLPRIPGMSMPSWAPGAASTGAGIMGAAALPAAVIGAQMYGGKADTQAELDYVKSLNQEFGLSGEAMDPDRLEEIDAERLRLSKVGPKIGFFDMFKEPPVPYETSGEVATRLPGESSMDAVFRQGKERAIARAAKETANKNTGGAKKNEFKESDERTALQKEADEIKKALGDKDLDKAELAFLVAKAARTGGSLSDKLDVATTEAMKLASSKRKRDRETTLLAYKSLKDTEAAKIKAGEKTSTQKSIEDYAVLKEKVGAGKASALDKTMLKAYETGVFKDESDTQIKAIGTKLVSDVNGIEDIIRAVKKGEAIKSRDKDEEKKYQTDIAKLKRRLDMIKASGFDLRLLDIEGYEEGGRVMRAMGSPEMGETSSGITSTEIPQGNNDTPVNTVNKLSFSQLRERLPAEITDDVVTLLANSEQALQDFAYLRTQQDINGFNVKYGVNVVLPSNKG